MDSDGELDLGGQQAGPQPQQSSEQASTPKHSASGQHLSADVLDQLGDGTSLVAPAIQKTF